MLRRKESRALVVLLGAFALASCSDINFPDVTGVDAVQGGGVIEALEPSEVDEDQFATHLPVDVSFVVHFDETMDLTSARENIWIEDQARTPLPVVVTAVLQDVTVSLASGTLAPGQNHVLHIGDDIEDIAGWELVNGYDISFFTEM